MAGNILGNNWFEGVLGVCQIEFNGVNLGKTMNEIEVTPIEDIQDIFFSQDGTQPADKIVTGQAYEVTCMFGEIDRELINEVLKGITLAGGGQAVKMGRNLYVSGKASESHKLQIKRVDSEGTITTDPDFIASFYKAFPSVTGSFVYGPDSQRGLEVTFYIFYDETNTAYGYVGNPTSLGLIAVA